MNNMPKTRTSAERYNSKMDKLWNKCTKAKDYEQRVQAYENQGMTRSDAQAIVDAEDLKNQTKIKHTELEKHIDNINRAFELAVDMDLTEEEYTQQKASADFAIHALKCHYKLLEACKEAVNDLDQYQKENEEMNGHISPKTERVISQLEQAIKESEG